MCSAKRNSSSEDVVVLFGPSLSRAANNDQRFSGWILAESIGIRR